MSVFEDKIARCWEKHGEEVGRIVSQYDSELRRIVRAHSKGYDFDELYSDYVIYLMPVYIENYDDNYIKPGQSNKTRVIGRTYLDSGLRDWIYYCIKRRIIKHVYNRKGKKYNQEELSEDLICRIDPEIGIGRVEEMCASLSRYDTYLVREIVVRGFTVTEVADVNKIDRRTVRGHLDLALHRLKLKYQYDY